MVEITDIAERDHATVTVTTSDDKTHVVPRKSIIGKVIGDVYEAVEYIAEVVEETFDKIFDGDEASTTPAPTAEPIVPPQGVTTETTPVVLAPDVAATTSIAAPDATPVAADKK